MENEMRGKSNKFGMVIAGFLVVVGIALTLFRHWEPSGESWGYWFFARIFAETGKFVIIDRSPLYALYLNMFRWLGYPSEVVVEYVVTSLIVVVSLIILFRRYVGLFWAVFAVFLWIPFFQVAEPPVQKLALAFSCLAIAVRDMKVSRFRLAISYTLLGFAYMLRCTYIVFILIFAIWDSVKIFRQKNLKSFLATTRPKLCYWPILLILILLIWFNVMQFPHPWNNAWVGATTTWFPCKGKTLADASFIQNYNWEYISYKYGTFKDKDFYFTNQELFDGASDMIGAIRANPRFVATQIVRNIKKNFHMAVSFTMLPHVIYKIKKTFHMTARFTILPPVFCKILFSVPFVFIILYGAFRACKNESMVLFLIANIFLIGTVIISLPKTRYMHPLIPILILSAFWYGKQARNILTKSRVSSQLTHRLFSIIGYLIIPFVFIFFSNGLMCWKAIIGDIISDVRDNKIKIMERRPYSLKASFELLQPLIRNCNGVLSLESTFIGAFMDIPVCKIYDIWEIPPFGYFGNSSYDGLHPDRIDCVLVSHNLATNIGCATNYQIRYQNYIMPYARRLKEKGAKVYEIEGFGQAVIYRNSR